jgi:hypothetical protein
MEKIKGGGGGGEGEGGGEKVSFAKTPLKTDLFGMTLEDWDMMYQHIRDGNLTLQDTADIVASIAEAWSMYNQLRSNLENQAMMDYESNNNKKKELLQKQLENGLISQELYNQQVSAMDDELDSKKRELAIKQAKREKAVALVSAIVNTALAVVKALGTSPPWLGIVLAALVGVMGGLQIATIASQPIPQYATGLYDVIGDQDGKKYRAPVIRSPGTGMINEPAILVGEKPELIIDPLTTRNLQMNYPGVIEAIQAARLPQYAVGSYPASRETVTERPLPKEFYDTMNGFNQELRRLNDRLNKGIGAKLVADSDYVVAHNEVMEDYDTLRRQVDMRD